MSKYAFINYYKPNTSLSLHTPALLTNISIDFIVLFTHSKASRISFSERKSTLRKWNSPIFPFNSSRNA